MASTKTNIRAFPAGDIRQVPIFSELTDEEAAEIGLLITRQCVPRGQVVLSEEDTSKFMYIILSGKVKVIQLSDDGKERILAIHRRNDFFGELSLFDGKTEPATVIAMEETEIGLLSKTDLDRFLMKNREVLYHFISMLCSRLRESCQMLKVMSFADAEERVRAVLKNMIKRYGVKDQRGVLVTLKLTQIEIANYASVSRETVSRLMNRLSRSGEIELLENRHLLIKSSFLKKPPPL
ncbi:Crp/Fnr family transcriptional regulator [Geomesophilobacter sediminis]|uniref:Crp/Fnr family transcriptional regulator n=1 Tax=Geomesophilobacter sediminis TaxID=2798584 RepID=A0A8J7SDS7_9BACT|nr:Crp/Fnr family transcriptional regulator [Geomesophilobacter sediminis]MBJ6727964.1 Crp/Fnr family transcriptional regulator [Geomesophilobacter sediminis]